MAQSSRERVLSTGIWGLPWWLSGKESAMQDTSLGWDYPLEKEMATHSSILAWKIPWTEESGRLQSMGSQESDMT